MFNKEEKIELGLIVLTVLAFGLWSQNIPGRIESGYVVLILGLLFLFQTLVRDLWLLWRLRNVPKAAMPTSSCMCLESGVGFVPVAIAAFLLFSGMSRPVSFAGWSWTLSAAAVMLSGFALKDYVVDRNPWRVRKDPDHINMRFVWRSNPRAKK